MKNNTTVNNQTKLAIQKKIKNDDLNEMNLKDNGDPQKKILLSLVKQVIS